MGVLIYLEPSALFKAYIPERGTKNVEWVLSILGKELVAITSRWTILEIVRGFVKRRNLGELSSEDLRDIVDFFMHDIERMELEKKLIVADVSKEIILGSIELLKLYNLYAADAVHVKTAEAREAKAILVDDQHYDRISGATKLKVINVEVDETTFKKSIKQLFSTK